ncbi:MAG: DNA polymerase III subunit alpha [Candidatus Moranbacteria bacterium CG23_combo_of_CG06-09_8_20_14_all_39_10]|nr:MAG: DNA polymerase III subunit alpha [Candidatus Moranbacteria bacterium CG23_combo_of_CG06-09_8_20_14_all_39_10]
MSETITPKFTHLHVHTHYSLLDGLAKVDKILDQAKELGMDSLAITDHGVLYGAIEFYIKAKERGIKPIIGCEFYITANDLHSKNPTAEDKKRFHLIVLAKNEAGYKNLMRLITIAHLEGFYYKPRIDRKTLRQYSEGLIGLSACAQGEVPAHIIMGDLAKAEELALEYQDIFGAGDFYFEIQHHPKYANQEVANQGLIALGKKLGIKLVATNDIHYIKKEDAEIQDILLCIQTNRKVDEKDRMNLMDFELYLKSPEEMAEHFAYIPEAIANTQEIVDKCNLEIKLGETQLPHFDFPVGFTAQTYLEKLCEDGLVKRFGLDITKEHRERMDYEMGVIEKTGYASYFLIVQDFVNWAKNKGIVVGPGRGSAAGSFVSYLVGITNIDPIKYDLLFERFLNPERVSMPDVDMDFADDRRDDVLQYVRRKYGNDHVAQIITFGTMAARAAVRDAGRALGIPYDFCDKAAKLIPQFSTIEEALEESKEFKDFYGIDPSAKKLIDSAKRLEGVIRHASMHACGVVITKEPVTEYTPLQNIIKGGENGGTVTQYSSSTKSSFVEKIGLLKMDFLGLKNLTIIQNTLRIVKKLEGLEVNIDTIPLDDAKAFELLQRAETTGVFQLESSGMKRYLKLLKPTKLEDIIAMVALYRPGPMDWIPDFIARKHGLKKMSYLHPNLEPILNKTYGVAVYQEQVMQIARNLAGFSMGEADVLRKAMGKKIFALIQEQKIKFIEGCVTQGVDRKIGEKVFEYIEPFAGYGFNRSHAACYGLIGYQTAYLKAHFPAPFMAALLTSDQDKIDRVAIEVSECRDMGIEVMAPHINESFEEFAVIVDPETKKSRIRFGLNAIKNVGHNIAHEIVEERKKNGKFKSLTNFVERVQNKDLNKKSIEALAKVGALEGLGERNQIVASIENIISHSKTFQKNQNSQQGSLFGASEIALPEITMLECEPATKKQRLSWEKELMGLYISDHPAREYKDYFNQMGVPIKDISSSHVGQNINVGGVLSKIHKIYLKTQKTMLFVTIEDTDAAMEILVFPKVLDATDAIWEEDKVVLVSGKISDKDGNFKILCDTVTVINQAEVEKFSRVLATRQHNEKLAEKKNDYSKMIITLPSSTSQDILKKLSQYFDRCEAGAIKVFLSINNSRLETAYCIAHSDTLENNLKNIVPEAKVEIY